MQFDDLRLCAPILRAIHATGYTTPTPIQAKAIPIILDGRDVLGCAQTGTGKTAAFALPILHQLLETGVLAADTPTRQVAKTNQPNMSRSARRRRGNRKSQRPVEVISDAKPRVLVLAPTRELAQQIEESFLTYSADTGIRTVAIFGGVGQNPQTRAIRSGVDVVIATPGRLLDLMGQELISLENIEVLVLDEADRMLDMGFLPDIRRIPRAIPRERQSLLFSATMPQPIRVLASEMLRDPVSVEVARVSAPAVKVSHAVYHVEMPEKLPLLIDLLNQAPGDRALVFTRTKHGADKVVRILEREGIPAAAMHGNKSQNARNRALEGFRTGKTPVLVATDLAARGLDVDDIALVVNYDLTPDPETYIHRIGRTGRAGASGHAISFCTPTEQSDLRAIEKLLRVPMEHIRRTPSRAKVSQAVSPHRPERHEKTRSPRRQRRRARTAR